MGYIITVKFPNNNIRYISKLDFSDFTTKCSCNILDAYVFYDLTTAWLVAKAKYESYNRPCEIEVKGYDEENIKIYEMH